MLLSLNKRGPVVARPGKPNKKADRLILQRFTEGNK
jgi:hypothetical protein